MTKARQHWFGFIGTLLGSLGMLAAATPVWILPVLQPPEPIAKVVVDSAKEIKDRLLAKAQGKEYQEPRRPADLYQIFPAVAVTLGVLALACAGVSTLQREPRRFAVVSATLGAAAIVFQFSLLVVGVLLIALVVAAVLGELGVGS